MQVLRFLASALALTLAAGATAAPLLTGSLHVTPSFAGGTGPYNATGSQAVGAVSVNGAADDGRLSFGSGSVVVDYGVIKMRGDISGAGNTVASGSFSDTLRFSSPQAADGSTVSVTFALLVDGSLPLLSSPGLASAGWTLRADLGGGAYDLVRQATHFNDSPALGGLERVIGDAFDLYFATVNLVLGADEPLTVELQGRAQTGFQSGFPNKVVYAAFELQHSLYWAGIVGMSFGNQVLTDFSVQSDSGTDYRSSLVPGIPGTVPEPAAIALTLAALGLLAASRRRRMGR